MISCALGSFGKHLKNRQIPYQSVRGPLHDITNILKLTCIDYQRKFNSIENIHDWKAPFVYLGNYLGDA